MTKSCCAGKTVVVERRFRDKVNLYRPLIVIVAVSVSIAASLAMGGAIPFMRGVMGVFLSLLATLKLFNWQGFADSFSKYDLFAQRFRGYAHAYPLIELTLAWSLLSGFHMVAANVAMMAVMLFGSLGVMRVIYSGANVQCACVGSSFNLPVGRVTLAENLVMAGMAAMNLAHPIM
jgi:hypothetical protein